MSRKASMLARGCTVAAIVATMFFLAATANAAACDIPSFLKVDKTYNISTTAIIYNATVLAIDKQSCWVKIKSNKNQAVFWINLNQITLIEEIAE